MLRWTGNSWLDKVGGRQPQQSLCEVLEVQKKRSQPVQKFRDGEQFGARTIENSPALYLRSAAKIASLNTFARTSITFALQPNRQRSRGTGLFTDTGTLFASRALGEQNEVPANRIRQVSPWYPKHGSAKNLRPTPGWRPVEVQTQTSQLGGTVTRLLLSMPSVEVQDIPSVDADDLRLTSMKTPESTWERSCVRASSLQLR